MNNLDINPEKTQINNREGIRIATAFLIIGVILSLILTAASYRITNYSMGSIIFHLVMLLVLTLPFLIIYYISHHKDWKVATLTIGTLFTIGHIYASYTTYTTPPQEFGYIGLIFLPFVEAIVVIPLGLLIIFIINQTRKN